MFAMLIAAAVSAASPVTVGCQDVEPGKCRPGDCWMTKDGLCHTVLKSTIGCEGPKGFCNPPCEDIPTNPCPPGKPKGSTWMNCIGTQTDEICGPPPPDSASYCIWRSDGTVDAKNATCTANRRGAAN